MRVRRKVPLGKPNDFAVLTQQTLLNFWNDITKALFGVMGVFAEFERSMIQERVKAGLARARQDFG